MPRHKVPHAAMLHATKPKETTTTTTASSNTFPHSCLRLMLIDLLLLFSYFFFQLIFFFVYFFIVPYKSVDVANWKTRLGFLSVRLPVCLCVSVCTCVCVLVCSSVCVFLAVLVFLVCLCLSLSHFGGELGNIAGISLTFALIIDGFSNRFRTRVCVTWEACKVSCPAAADRHTHSHTHTQTHVETRTHLLHLLATGNSTGFTFCSSPTAAWPALSCSLPSYLPLSLSPSLSWLSLSILT